ncbi:hypothetical protein [Corynebacterium aquatimens]|uniref:hypothetical protein n=1 Tax=Corynebacterium aquatimens TaxID=1190508 RepID=UPI00254184DE|nr:hypothetical protein [Corynebacterium aquatimens]
MSRPLSSLMSSLSSVNPLSSVFTGQPSRSGSSILDALSVPGAASSLLSSTSIFAIPALVLAILGGEYSVPRCMRAWAAPAPPRVPG